MCIMIPIIIIHITIMMGERKLETVPSMVMVMVMHMMSTSMMMVNMDMTVMMTVRIIV